MWFDCQAVTTDVRRLEFDRPAQVLAPRTRHLWRKRKDQIERPVEAFVPEHVCCLGGARGVVRAVHPGEYSVVEALDPERHARGSRPAPLADRIRRDVFRIGFDGDFRAGSGRPAPAHEVEDADHAIGAKPGWCATAEVDAVDGALIHDRKAQCNFALERVHEGIYRHRAAHRDREVAIRTASRAERYVHINVSRIHCTKPTWTPRQTVLTAPVAET